MTTGRPAEQGRRRWFTLLELVLVMVIICTVLGAASPSLRGFFLSRQKDDAASRIISLTRLARSRSVSDGCVYRLNFDLSRRTCGLTVQRQGSFEGLGSSLGRPFRLPEEVDVELEVMGAPGRRDHVDFFPDGRTEPATIRLTDIKGGVIEVACAAPTEDFVARAPEEEG